jgi:rhamnose utilization protein RhaD (predicted bifunctional aldolase and dehydrogenase)/NAD(P)-dependent dehydrogenase (short-subunit alcohol dehydrogenase family)
MIFSIPDEEQRLLDDRVRTSRLIGGDEDLVLHGGGNTSVKLRVVNLAGKDVPSLFVKSSGSDLSNIEMKDFTALRMDDLEMAKGIEKMSDLEMVAYLKGCMLDHEQSSPSVEVFLHAFIKTKFVDHSHADYVVAITNTNLTDEEITKIFDGRIVVIPYVPPGFELARFFLKAIDPVDLSKYEGVILRNHGLVTWGDTAEESYDKHLRIVKKAETYIKKSWKGITLQEIEKEKIDQFIDFLPKLRGMLSRKSRKIITWDHSPEAVGYSVLTEAKKFETLGPATPDMLIRTKKNYLFVEGIGGMENEIDRFVRSYESDFKKFIGERYPMHDPYPSTIVIKGYGLVTAASSKKEADIIRDEAIHSFRVSTAAGSVGDNKFISERECYEMEYWPLQEAKLRKTAKKGLEGYIGIVTGAASGIGKTTCLRLAEEGMLAIGTDIDEKIFEVTNRIKDSAYGMRFDISNENSVKSAFREIVEKFGGIDVIFNNAGYLHPSKLEDITLEDLEKHINVNAVGTFIVTKEAFRVMKEQNIGGIFIFNVTKNVTNPGEGMASYGTSKAFAAQLSRYVALEGGKYGIRSNVINPDKIFRDSKIWEDGVLENRAKSKGISIDEYKKGNLLHIEVLPEHVANVVVSLIKENTFGATTGTMIPIDGGIK